MFDLDCGVRLCAFRAPPAADLDDIVSLYNTHQVAPLITKYFPVPRGEKVKEDFKKIIDHNSEMVCIIETIPQAPVVADGDSTKAEPQFVGITALWAHHPGVGTGTRTTRFSCYRNFGTKGMGRKLPGS